MHTRGRTATLFVVAFVLLTEVLVGCGGGGSQDNAAKKQSDQAAKKEIPQKKIALGKITRMLPDKHRLVLRPSRAVQGSEKVKFKVRKNAKITLSGKKAELGDIKEGQQAQIEYVVKNEVNRAVVLHLFEAGDQSPGEGEKTG